MTTMVIERMRLGDIEERRRLNPRGRLRQDKVQEYVRRLLNGEIPPPMKVCSNTHILIDGAHTLNAYKEYLGESWEDHVVEVIPIEDMPDPDQEPAAWRARATVANRNHGVPVSRYEKRLVLQELVAAQGEEAALEWATDFNETAESLRTLLSLKTSLEQGMASAVEASGTPNGSGSVLPPPRVGATEPGTCAPGTMRGYTPPVRYHCRELRKALVLRHGTFDEKDQEEMQVTLLALQEVLKALGN